MSVDTQPVSETAPVLRREALLPNERNRGLGTVAVVCTMAGVASGLALATTLMAMQVADSMSMRTCPYRIVATPEAHQFDLRSDHGFLGVQYVFHDGVAEVDRVLHGTPAEAINLRRGDHILSVGGAPIRSASDLQERIFTQHPGTQTSLIVERNGQLETFEPTLTSWPVVQY